MTTPEDAHELEYKKSLGYGLERLGAGIAWAGFWIAIGWTVASGAWG